MNVLLVLAFGILGALFTLAVMMIILDFDTVRRYRKRNRMEVRDALRRAEEHRKRMNEQD